MIEPWFRRIGEFKKRWYENQRQQNTNTPVVAKTRISAEFSADGRWIERVDRFWYAHIADGALDAKWKSREKVNFTKKKIKTERPAKNNNAIL